MTEPAQSAPGSKLDKEITLRQLFSLAFGSIIGVGWITVLGLWLSDAGPYGAALAFVGGGFVILLIGLCYAELATVYPVAGGAVAFAHEVIGVKASFLVGWLLTLGYVGVVIFEVISVGWILEALVPALKGPALYSLAGSEISAIGLGTGVLGMVALAWFNIRGAKQAAMLQEVLTYGLLAIVLVFAGFAFVNGDAANLQPGFAKNADGLVLPGILAVIVTAPYWYSGFDVIPQALGEKSENASIKLVPITLLLAIGVAAAFYALVILAAAISLPRVDIIGADLPTADAIAAAMGSKFGSQLVLVAGLLGLVTAWNAFTFGAARVLFAMGRAKLLPQAFGGLHRRHNTPAFALIFISALGVGGAFLGKGAIGPIVDTGALAFSLVYLTICICSAIYAKRADAKSRVFIMPGGTPVRWLAILSATAVTLYAFYAPLEASSGTLPVEWLVLLFWIGLGLLFFWLSRPSAVTPQERTALIPSDF
ncbi:MAG: APC family permease [Pseudomonadota bacterium]